MTEIKEIEEVARLHYMDRKVDEITDGENATIAGVISDLKADGYHIEEKVSGANTVTGIVLNENSIKLNKNIEKELTYTLVYGEATVRYFAEVRGKYYEIEFNNENIIVHIEAIDLEGIDNTPKVIAQSNAENIATARTGENDTIVINSLNELGEAIVTVKEENSGTTVTCNVKVMILIEGITFKQDTITIEKGNNIGLNTLVIINPTDATEELVWTAENGEIVEITEDGKLVGVKAGTTTIKVTNEDGTIEATCQVKVVISATGIALNKSTTTINKGNTDSLTVTLTPADTTDPVSWTTESAGIATVTADATGRTATIRAVGAGTTKITVTCGSKIAYCTVIVKVPATGLTISQTSATVKIGDTLQLTAIATPSDTTDTITWKSSSTSVATVSNSGLVTGIKNGTATITVVCGTQSATCEVTVQLFSGISSSTSDPEKAMPTGNVTIIEDDATKGIVIKDKNNIEWVWIQVPKTVFTTAKNNTDYTNIKEDLIKYAGVYREGAVGQTNENWNDEWCKRSGVANSGTYNQMYNAMLKSVYDYGGFWIQRRCTIINDSDCAGAQSNASKVLPDENKKCSLLFGIQWDLVCKYLEAVGGISEKEIRENSTSWGAYQNSSNEVLNNEELRRKMNIYDFAGKGYEWTLESGCASNSTERYPIHRGASFTIYGSGIGGTAATKATMSTYSIIHSVSTLKFAWRATFY